MATLAFQGLSGVAGGLGLLADPSGATLGLPRGWLVGSPFEDYLIPGAVLLLVLGVAPLIVARQVWAGRRGGWLAAVILGAALVTWIAVQVRMIGYRSDPPLQAVYGALGLLIFALGLAPSVRRYARR